MAHLTLGVVASPRPWRAELQSHLNNHVAGIHLRVLREPQAAAEEHLDVLVVDDVTSFLTRNLLRTLRQQNVRVVGVYDPDAEDGFGARYLDDLGVDLTLPSTISAADLVSAVESFGPSIATDDDLALLVESAFGAEDETEDGRGSVVVVGGPIGGSGVTEVAIALAASFARRQESTVLLEVDEVGPSLAPRLLYDLEPNVLTALHDVHHGTATLNGVFGVRTSRAADITFAVVPGLAMVADWPLVRGDELVVLIDELSRRFVHVVVAAGPILEDLGGNGPERFGASRASIVTATHLVGVCAPSPLGVLRLLEWWAELQQLTPGIPVSVAVNRAPASAYRRQQLEQEIRENVAPELVRSLMFLPEDERVTRGAWDGTPAARGPFTRAVDELADALVPHVHSRRRLLGRRAG